MEGSLSEWKGGSGLPHVQSDGPQHQRAIADVADPHRLHDRFEFGGAGEGHSRGGQIIVCAFVAAEQGRDARYEFVEVELKEITPDGCRRASDFQADDPATRFNHALLLGKGGGDFGDIAHQEAGTGGIEGIVGEGKPHGISLGEGDAFLLILHLADQHHLVGEVAAEYRHIGMLFERFQGDIRRAGGDIEQAAFGWQIAGFDDHPAPALILPDGHQPVHQVIAAGGFRKHLPHVSGFFIQGGEW